MSKAKLVHVLASPYGERLRIEHPECSNASKHTPCPAGYLAWHDWAEAMYKSGARQRAKCPECRLWAIWTPPTRPTRALKEWLRLSGGKG